jgi:hypothetical protein
MRACPGMRILDGVEVSEKEREKAERLLERVWDGRRGAGAGAAGAVPPTTTAAEA